MTVFIKRLSMFLGIISIICIIFLTSWFFVYAVPPPNFSNSYSFNEKIRFIKNNYQSNQVDILTMGSSMSLNNIYSKAIVDKFNTQKYLNTASWGQVMSENYALLKILNKKYQIKTLLISSNLPDFRTNTKIFRYSLLDKYLSSGSILSLFYYLKSVKLQYLIQEAQQTKDNQCIANNYKSLQFDNYGAVNFDRDNFEINKNRWEGEKIIGSSLDSIQYLFLDSINSFCLKNNIKLYFIQSPFRKNYYLNRTDEEKLVLNKHLFKTKKILEKNNQIYINTINKLGDDSLFVDASHLNKQGAKIYTEYFLKAIQK